MDIESLGPEVMGEIRRAIVAKLEELQAYIDDELPAYIMVMIKNKKPIDQMSNDLGLFLNDNAPPFTAWLEKVLEKLKNVTQGKLDKTFSDERESL